MRAPKLRTRLVITTTMAALLTVSVLVLGVQVLLARMTSAESLRALRERADAAATTVQGTPAHPRVTDVPSNVLDQNLWIFDRRGHRIDGGRASAGLSATVASMSRVTQPSARDVAGRYRLFAEPVRSHGRGPVVAVVVAGVSLRPYEASERHGLWLSLALGVLAVGAAATASWVGATYSLRRVHEMAARADDWREHDLTRRFAAGPPRDELGELAQTLDRMLDRIAEALLAERRLTDEVAHELRTPLTVIRTEAQLALQAPELSEPAGEAMSNIVEATTRMDGSISTILAAARSTTGENQQCVVAVALAEARRRAPSRAGVTVSVVPDEAALRVAAPAEVVTATLAPIVDNAVRHARTSVELLVRADPPRVLVVVEDDGPGVAQDQAEAIFTAGHTSRHGGAGLGLALSRRLARSIGATVRAEPGERGRFVVDLPSS